MSLDLKALGATAARIGFSVADSITVAGTLKKKTAGTYNATTGAPGDTIQDVSISPMMLNFKTEEMNGDTIRRGDKKILIEGAALGSTVIGLDDYFIESASGKEWQIKSITLDATGNIWTLAGRAIEA